ncbi:SRPBCC family protein [Tenacibaculum sp. IB213877]|uniref:SRPBCC family protein n=1 Tax=Tenacibaculum sp. IB213877 TaxID=3097351 RepID=UPI002A59A893|nr:GyrI-like domain-containing protein [Tenacibaculum sp. IB213877]MDY0780270.1 GyrI-like domain-containing protein [Tenacibaculum sp. IB213877]
MKFLRYLLLFFLGFVVVGLLYISMQPGSYQVSRSKVVKYPITDVYNAVNDIKTWEKWGPWHDEDSTIVVTYGDTTVGVGASDSWTSKEGPGSMKTIAVEPNKSIRQEIRFGNSDPSDILWDFEEVPEGTKITWTMKDEKAPFMFKMFSSMSGGWDKMLGPMLEKGLLNLDNAIKEMPKKFRITEGKIVLTEDKMFLGVPYKMKIDQEAMMQAFQTSMPKVGEYAMQAGLKYDDFTPGALYHKWDEKTGETEFHIGVLLDKEINPAEGMEVIKIPGSKTVVISKYGNYGDGDYEAHTKIDEYLKANNLTSNWPIYELYVNDPTKVKPADIQTDIYYPIK